jgi:branched-chain amino acid transport system permease protein
MSQISLVIYQGLVLGAIYALMALAFTLVYGALRFLNLSLGALFTLGAYVAFVISGQLGLPAIAGIVGAFVLVGLAGVGVYQIAVRPLVGRPGWEIASIISTLGVGIVIQQLIQLVWGPRNQAMPEIVSGNLRVGDVLVIQYQRVAVVLVSLVVMTALWFFLTRSRHGLAIRAVAQNRDAAYLNGASVNRIFMLVMALGSGLAAVAGVLLSTVLISLNPTVGLSYALRGLVVTIFGGLGSITGTLAAAFIIGLFEAFVSVYLGEGWKLPALFLFLIVVLVIRPGGLAGVSAEERT